MSQALLFHRDFRAYSGGHGKVLDYFGHARAHPGWSPRFFLAPGSVDEDNPWLGVDGRVDAWEPERADALFLGGMDWLAYPADDPRRPVVNLVQHVRHADPDGPLHGFLARRAIRICVGAPVAEAIRATGRANGPVLVIEAALNLPAPAHDAGPRQGVFIDALKHPALGEALHRGLVERGHEARLSRERMPRARYLEALASADVAVLLPHATEGFYLPALEAMALGSAVVVPDCVGNRAYLEPGRNALVPPAAPGPLLEAVEALADPARRDALVAAGRRTAARFDLARERHAFHAVLDDLPALWRQ